MNGTVIQQQCDDIVQICKDKNEIERWQTFFNTIVIELEKNEPIISVDFNIMSKIVSTLTKIDKADLDKSAQMKNHLLWTILRDYLIKYLYDQEKITIITDLSIIFRNIYLASVNIDHLVQLFLHNPMINTICLFFKQIEIYSHQTELVTVIDRLMFIYQRILMLISDAGSNRLLLDLFESIVECMNSGFFTLLLTKVTSEVPVLDASQTLFLDTCIEFLYWQPYEDDHLRRKILCDLSKNMMQTIRTRISFKQHSKHLLRLDCLLAFNMVFTNEKNESKELDTFLYQIIDYCIEQLACEQSPIVQRTILEILCHLTHDIDLTVYMKESSSLKASLLNLTNVEDGEISFGAYRILAMIMTEQDIKSLENATKIVGIYYLYTISMLDDPLQKTAFLNLLYSLKCLVQHEQMKIECIEQGLVPLLIQCIVQDNVHTKTVQQYALEILLALSLVNKGSALLKSEPKFIERIQSLKNSDDLQVQRAVDHILWQLEQQSNNTTRTTLEESEFQFDIMISYSHNDKNICFQLFDHLIKDGYRVWLDREQMHGDTMAAMAHAIENSEYVLICMSEAYKQSPYCQAEAHYAFQRRCKLIPLVMKAKYKADGWLGIMVSGKIYVDFSKFDFTSAYSMVKTEMEKKRLGLTNTGNTGAMRNHDQALLHSPPIIPASKSTILELPHCVDMWSVDDVHSFLVKNNLNTLLPVVGNFNGHLLHQTYLMCQTGRETMFQAMRNEVATTENGQILTLGTYLRFQEELKKFIPINNDNIAFRPVSTICTIT